MRLILVRHALPHRSEAAGPVNGPAGGGADPALTELGHRQAERVAEALRGEPISELYSSPQLRARQTGEPLARALGRKPEIVAGLAEFDARDRHYIPVHEMAHADPDTFQRLLDGYLPAHVDVEAFGRQVEETIAEIAQRHPGAETVVCFAHAGVINVYLMAVLGLARPLSFPLDYTGITRVSVSRSGRRTVRTVNEIAHVADLLDPAAAQADRS